MSAIRCLAAVVVVTSIVTISTGAWAQKAGAPPQIVTDPPVVTIDSERLCPLVDGEPFFVLGACGITEDQMQVAADAGFNLAIRWSVPGQLKNQIVEEDEAAKQVLRE